MDKLVIGCGYLGRRVAERWRSEGHRVFATTRNLEHAGKLQHLDLEPVVCDVLDPTSLAPLPAVDTVVYCVGFDRAAGKYMRDVYVNGLANVLRALPRPGRFLYVSSTGVYGQTAGQGVTEDAVTEPDDEPGRIVLEAEQLLRRRLHEAVILRFAGIYGPGRLIRAEALRAGEPLAGDPEKLLNLIHVEDGAAAVLAAETRAQPGATFNISDDLPVRRQNYYECLAHLIGAPEPRFIMPAPGDAQPRGARPNRRIVNRRMHEELMVQLRYPSYREGLPAALASQASNLSP